MFRKLATAVSLIGLLTSNTLYAKEISEADKVIKATKETKETKKEAKRLKKEAKQRQQIPDHKKPQYASVDDTKTQALFDIYDTLNVNDKSFGDWFGNSALKDKTYLYAMDLLDYNNYLSIENPIIKTRAMGTYADLIIITGSLEQVNGYYNILKALNKRNAKFVLKINENMPYAQATFLRVPKRSDPNSHTLDKGAAIDENKLFEQQKRAYFNYANDVICRPNDEVCSPLRDEMVAMPTSDSVTQKPNIIAPYSLYRLKETNNANEAQPSPYATQTAPENSKEKLIEELIANSQLIANEEEREKKLLAEKEKQEAELAKYRLKDLENQKKLKALKAELKKKNVKKPRVVEVPVSPQTSNSDETMRVIKEKENYNGLLVDKETTIKRSYEGTLISENSYSKKSPLNPNDLRSLEEEIKSYYIKSNGLCYANGISLYVKIKNDPYKEGMLCGYESVQNLLSPLKDKLKYDKQKLQKALLKDSKWIKVLFGKWIGLTLFLNSLAYPCQKVTISFKQYENLIQIHQKGCDNEVVCRTLISIALLESSLGLNNKREISLKDTSYSMFHITLNTAKKFYPTYSKTLLKFKLLNDVGFAIQLAKQILKENFDYYKQKYPNKSVYQLVEMAIGAYNGGMKHDPNGTYVKKFRCIYSQVRYNE